MIVGVLHSSFGLNIEGAAEEPERKRSAYLLYPCAGCVWRAERGGAPLYLLHPLLEYPHRQVHCASPGACIPSAVCRASFAPPEQLVQPADGDIQTLDMICRDQDTGCARPQQGRTRKVACALHLV